MSNVTQRRRFRSVFASLLVRNASDCHERSLLTFHSLGSGMRKLPKSWELLVRSLLARLNIQRLTEPMKAAAVWMTTLWSLERGLYMVGRAAGSLRSSQNGPKGQLLIWFLFSVPYTGKILSVSLQRRGFLSSLVMVTLCLSKERATEGRAQMRSWTPRWRGD